MLKGNGKILNNQERIWEIDTLRGLAIILMCFDHFMYDLSIMDGMFTNFWIDASDGIFELYELGEWWFWESTLRQVGHYIFATLFLLITGISCTLSKSNLARIIKLALFSLILTVSTVAIDSVMDMGATILFGVIQCMTVGCIMYALIDKLPKSDYILLFVSAVLIGWGILLPWYDVPHISTIDYTLSEFIPMMLKVMLGYASAGGDHFGIFPCCGVILLGSYIGKKFYAERKSLLPKLDGKWNIGLRWIGKRTAWIYLSHQPIIMLIVMLIGLVSGLEVF